MDDSSSGEDAGGEGTRRGATLARVSGGGASLPGQPQPYRGPSAGCTAVRDPLLPCLPCTPHPSSITASVDSENAACSKCGQYKRQAYSVIGDLLVCLARRVTFALSLPCRVPGGWRTRLLRQAACSGARPQVVALVRGADLWVANAGDSRCVVSRRGRALALSHDHKPTDEGEAERIAKVEP